MGNQQPNEFSPSTKKSSAKKIIAGVIIIALIGTGTYFLGSSSYFQGYINKNAKTDNSKQVAADEKEAKSQYDIAKTQAAMAKTQETLAKTAADTAKNEYNNTIKAASYQQAKTAATNAKTAADKAKAAYSSAEKAANSSKTYATKANTDRAKGYAKDADKEKTNAKTSSDNAKKSSDEAKKFSDDANAYVLALENEIAQEAQESFEYLLTNLQEMNFGNIYATFSPEHQQKINEIISNAVDTSKEQIGVDILESQSALMTFTLDAFGMYSEVPENYAEDIQGISYMMELYSYAVDNIILNDNTTANIQNFLNSNELKGFVELGKEFIAYGSEQIDNSDFDTIDFAIDVAETIQVVDASFVDENTVTVFVSSIDDEHTPVEIEKNNGTWRVEDMNELLEIADVNSIIDDYSELLSQAKTEETLYWLFEKNGIDEAVNLVKSFVVLQGDYDLLINGVQGLIDPNYEEPIIYVTPEEKLDPEIEPVEPTEEEE